MLESLRAVAIDLPDDTNDVNFMERLIVALRQKKASENPEEDSITNPPEGAKEQPAPVAMSQEKETDVKEVTPQATAEEVLSHPSYQAATKTISFLMSHLNGQEKAKLQERRNTLLAGGKVSEDYASKYLDPAISDFKMSFGEDGSVEVCNAATIMDALEAAPSLVTGILGKGQQPDANSLQQLGLAMSQSGMSGIPAGLEYQEEVNPDTAGPSADDIAMEFLRNTGHGSVAT
jgi:hypothetical protein